MQLLKICSFACSFLLLANIVTAQEQIPNSKDSAYDLNEVLGYWKNQEGSTLEIESVNNETGEIVGYYVSPSGTLGEKFPLTGWVNYLPPTTENEDNVICISFMVRWGKYGSITSWTGSFRKENEKASILTLWHLVRANSNFSWSHINSGTDIFSRKNHIETAN